MMTGTLERERNCLHTSVPLIPGSIRSSSTMSAPARSNSARADGPSATTVASKPSLRRRKARGSAKDSSSSTINTLVIGLLVLSLVLHFQVIITMGVGGNRQGERRPRSRLAPQPDGSVVIGCDVFNDRQAQSGTAGGPGAGLVYAEEPLEHPLLVLACDADAAVGHRDLDIGPAPAPADRDVRTVGRVGNGIRHQVG